MPLSRVFFTLSHSVSLTQSFLMLLSLCPSLVFSLSVSLSLCLSHSLSISISYSQSLSHCLYVCLSKHQHILKSSRAAFLELSNYPQSFHNYSYKISCIHVRSPNLNYYIVLLDSLSLLEKLLKAQNTAARIIYKPLTTDHVAAFFFRLRW